MDDDDGMFMFDSLENSLEDFNELGHMLSSQNCGGQSPMSSYLSQASSLRVEFGACTRLGPKSKQEDRFVMIPSLDTPRGTGAEVEGYDDDSNTHRCEYSYAAVYDGKCIVALFLCIFLSLTLAELSTKSNLLSMSYFVDLICYVRVDMFANISRSLRV